MSLIAHPEILRRRRIWEEKELIEPQFGRKTVEEAEVLRQRIIQEEIAKREREHQIHLSQFELERVYSNSETNIVFILGFLLICFMLLIFPWQSPSTLWKPDLLMESKNGTTTWSDIPKTLKKHKAPPMPRPLPFPNPRRLEVKSLFIKQRPKTLAPPAKAMPMVVLKKDQAKGGKTEEENSKLQDVQLRPTQSSTSSEAGTEHTPPPPSQTKGSQDWTFTLGNRVSKRLDKGRRNTHN